MYTVVWIFEILPAEDIQIMKEAAPKIISLNLPKGKQVKLPS